MGEIYSVSSKFATIKSPASGLQGERIGRRMNNRSSGHAPISCKQMRSHSILYNHGINLCHSLWYNLLAINLSQYLKSILTLMFCPPPRNSLQISSFFQQLEVRSKSNQDYTFLASSPCCLNTVPHFQIFSSLPSIGTCKHIQFMSFTTWLGSLKLHRKALVFEV